jgi:hypothetical protein
MPGLAKKKTALIKPSCYSYKVDYMFTAGYLAHRQPVNSSSAQTMFHQLRAPAIFRFDAVPVLPILAYQRRVLLLFVLVLLALAGCKSSEVAPAQEYMTYKVDGKAYTDNDPASLIKSNKSFDLISESKATADSPYHIMVINVKNAKIGTFTAQSSQITGDIIFNTVTPTFSIKEYDILDKGNGTVTFTAYNPDGLIEGTFSFVGTDKTTNKTVSVTEGKFRFDYN